MFKIDKNKTINKSILILSNELDRLNLITKYLTVRGLDVKVLKKNLFELTPKDLEKNIEGVILDLQTIVNKDEILEFICKILPKHITCIVLADNDSIKIKQEFLNRGIKYLHFETQLNHVYDELKTQVSHNAHSINIMVLGTKGGVGNSFISYQLANIIYRRYKTKVLCVQGAYSSFNLDLFSDRKFSVQDFRDNDISLYRENNPDLTGFDKFSKEKFNFMVYDFPVQSLDKDKIDDLLNISDCVVLVINSELTSIRRAKEIIQANDFLLSLNQGVKRLIIALNELSKNKTLSTVNMEEILMKAIDITIPYGSTTEVKNIIKGRTYKALEKLSDLLIGDKLRKNKAKTLFKGLL